MDAKSLTPISTKEAGIMFRDNGAKPFSFLMTSGVRKTTYAPAPWLKGRGGLYAVNPDLWRPSKNDR